MRSALLVFVVLAGLAGTARAGSLYVSPTGGSAAPCSLAVPCSLAHAQTVAQSAIATGLTAPLNVYLRGGTYTQATGLTFGAEDSGTSSNPVTWQSYPGEVATISGGSVVTGWTLDTGSIYKANVGTGWNFRQLYVNGVHAPRTHGSFNPSGWTRTATGYTPPDDSMMSWGNPTDVTIVSLGTWSEDMGKAAALSTSGSTSTTVFTGSVTDWVYQGPYASLEVGTAFTSDVAGQVTGLRFWRSQLTGGDTGTHTGHLWDNSGNLLATATFSASSATGWSDVTLSSPVSITASTTYVVSYDSTIITVTTGVFPVTNSPMHGSAGVYSETPGTFPTLESPNTGGCYWVDVDFQYSAGTTNAITMTNPFWANQQAILSAYDVRATPSRIENAYELLAANSWYLNRTTGYLYLWLADGSNPANATVVAPVVDHLLTVSGASYLNFGFPASPSNPIVFAYSNWTGPDSTTGYVGIQSGYTYVTYNTVMQLLDAAVTVNASTSVAFNGDEFAHLGSRALLVKGGSNNVSIIGNRFDDNAAGAMQIGDVGTAPYGDVSFEKESGITVYGNTISAGNAFDYLDNGAIFAPAVTDSTIANNEIDSTPWSPIAIGWGWGTTAFATNNSISGNNINGACIGPLWMGGTNGPLGWDCGSIYTVGPQSASSSYETGLRVTGNYSTRAYPIGLYADMGSAWETWSDNVLQNVYNYWFQIGNGINHINVVNNHVDNLAAYNTGTAISIAGTTLITNGTQSFGTPQQAVICAAGVPGATACATPTLWPTWQSGVGATWTRAQIGP